jgi:hypothetical protein
MKLTQELRSKGESYSSRALTLDPQFCRFAPQSWYHRSGGPTMVLLSTLAAILVVHICLPHVKVNTA